MPGHPAEPARGRPPDRASSAAAADGTFRVVAITLSHTLEEARQSHGTLPVATAALGRALAGAGLLALTFKGEGRLTLRLLGDGPLGAVVADASPRGDLRGYVQNPRVMLPPNSRGKLDVGRAVGPKGLLHVSHDIGLRIPYAGSVPITSGEIGDDLAVYLDRSAQIPSAVTLGVRVGSGGIVLGAAGILVQRMPDPDTDFADRDDADDVAAWEEIAAHVEAALESLGPVSSAAERGLAAEDLLEHAFAGYPHGQRTDVAVRWQCTCNRERTGRLLRAMGAETLEEMADEDGGAELRCHFCGRTYRFDADELRRLARDVIASDGPKPEDGA